LLDLQMMMLISKKAEGCAKGNFGFHSQASSIEHLGFIEGASSRR
jgi:hypothetical protein